MTTVDKLTELFKDNFVAYYRSHVAHVNIVGRNFQSDHKLLKGVYEQLQEQIDFIGELLRTLDAMMPCNLLEVVETSQVDPGELSGDADFLLEMVRNDLVFLIEQYQELAEISDEEDLSEIENHAQERILALRKLVWMFNSTLGSSSPGRDEESGDFGTF